MVAYSFQRQFEVPILAGTKRKTIRADRKRHARPGETLQLYVGMRTRQCRLIMTATCISIGPIKISMICRSIEVGDRYLTLQNELDLFACKDGFDDWSEMRAFWLKHHGADMPDPWSGVLIQWEPPDA